MSGRRGRIYLVLGAGAVSAALLVGCGDDDDAPITPVGPTGATGAGGPLSKSAFIDQADDICLEANTAIANLAVGEGGTEALVSQELSITEGLHDSLRSLGDPAAENRDDYETFLAALRDAIDALEEQDLATERGDTAAADAAASQVDAALEDAREAASDYGFEECGQEGEELATGGVSPSGDTGEAAPPATTPAAPAAPPATTPTTTPTTPTTPTAPPPSSGGTGTAPPSGGAGPEGTGGSGGVSP